AWRRGVQIRLGSRRSPEHRTHMAAMSEAAEAALAAYRRGGISPEIALMRLMLTIGDAAAVIERLEMAGEAELLRLAAMHGERLGRVAALVAAGLTDERGGIDAIRAQFDAAAAAAPEAAVALYSLGSADILDRATAEIAGRLREWGLLRA